MIKIIYITLINNGISNSETLEEFPISSGAKPIYQLSPCDSVFLWNTSHDNMIKLTFCYQLKRRR